MKNNPLTLILRVLGALLTPIFGKLNWSSPPWMTRLRSRVKNTPVLFWGITSLILVLTVTAVFALNWYIHRPQPDYVTAQIITPTVSPLTADAEPIIPNPLTLNFGIYKKRFIKRAVAPMALIGKSPVTGVEIRPHITGQWMWTDDNQLQFTPSEDWHAGLEYSIHFARNFFTPQTLMKRYDFSFKTKPFQVTISDLKLYQDVLNPQVQEALATLKFNYPVDPRSLEIGISLELHDNTQETKKSRAHPLKISYSYDQHHRIVYLRSEAIPLKKSAQYLALNLNKALYSSTNSAKITDWGTQGMVVPDTGNFLKINAASASIVRNDKDRPEQILTIESSLGISEKDFDKYVHIYLLPKDHPGSYYQDARSDFNWSNPGEVTPSVLSYASVLTRKVIPTEHNYASLHSFKFTAPNNRYIYIKVDKGMPGLGGFTLAEHYTTVLKVPELPKEISFLHQGSLLALGGEKKLSVLVRGMSTVKFDFARVLPENINQLVSQTRGDFNNPHFINPNFDQNNISQIRSDTQSFYDSDLSKQQYTALDLNRYLKTDNSTKGPQGLFLVKAYGWDALNQRPTDPEASRLILITDLGMLVKDNQDGSHEVYVQSITKGTPVEHVTISVLGKNGLPILSKLSDDQGHVHFPTLKDFQADQEPIVYLAAQGEDVSFIPFDNRTRPLNFSKFDVGGVYTYQDLQNLSAYLFSDRGIYRPGDTLHVGMIVKQTHAKPQPAGLPLQATIMDSRGTVIKEENLTLTEQGFMELDFTTENTAPTGLYTVNLYLNKDYWGKTLLGSTTVQVAEFQPDRMRISSNWLSKPSEGWTSPETLKAQVHLHNLYGAPAIDRKVSAKMVLTPQAVKWSNYPDYVFADPLRDPKKPLKGFTEELDTTKTNDKGEAEFNLHLERFEKATYQLTFFAEGFEAEGGRSVTTQSKILVSPLPYFLGYKPDGDLSFIKQNSDRNLHYIAINPQLTQAEVNDLKIELSSLRPITTLVKKPDGTYQYQSLIQSKLLSTNPFEVSVNGTHFSLPTKQIGDYSLKILDKENTVLSQLNFSVVGASQRPLAKNAELAIKLNKSEYQPGEDIEIQITAPYTGAGLITIERDKVYSSQWFKTSTTNSVQSIRIPADFQGNGYINIAFVRDWNSPELFISPLSYSVVPFSVSHEKQHIKINLKTPKVVRPGETLTMDYSSDKPAKIVVFAVDEGILQVARYTTPNPLAFFFQKYALEVLTQQTVDQILPKFIQDRELSAAGGDGGEADMSNHLNPFKRKADLPVVFWSGIIDSDNTQRQLEYQVPSYFNGSIQVMAVAVAQDSLGSQETITEARGDFIINPNVPTFVAPGDEFEITASIANNIKNSGDHTVVNVALSVTDQLEILGQTTQTSVIQEGREQSVRFRLKARAELGSAKVTLTVKAQNKESTMSATLSVRPAMPFTTQVTSGVFQQSKKPLDLIQSFYPQFRTAHASLSNNPLILIWGLQRYLAHYPYGCTEQLTSKAFPLLALNSQMDLPKDQDQINTMVNKTVQMLSQRQMSHGGFSYWPTFGIYSSNDFTSTYVMHFLTEAKQQGFHVPNTLFEQGLRHLKGMASVQVSNLNEARQQAYVIYILTRNEIVTTNYLAGLQSFLQKEKTKAWQNDLTSVFIAASYQLLKSTEDATQLIEYFNPATKASYNSDFYSNHVTNALYFYLVAKHFPNKLTKMDDTLLMQLVQTINAEDINTLLSAYVSLALSAYHQEDTSTRSFSITKSFDTQQHVTVSPDNANFQKLSLDPDVKQISLNNPTQHPLFYQLIQAGFDKILPSTPMSQHMEIHREFRNAKGEIIQSTTLGSEIEVHIKIRALHDESLRNIAIQDLLPGGFEVVIDSVKSGSMEFVDAREDRVNYFGSLDSNTQEIIYKIKAINTGTYTVPPAFAESMYHPEIKAVGVVSKMSITQ